MIRIFFDTPWLDTVALIATVIGLIYYYLTSSYSYWKSRGVPYIEPEFFFGNMKDIINLKKSQPEKMNEWYQYFKSLGSDYGGIFQLREPILLITSPEIVKDMAIKNFPAFHDRGLIYDENFDPLSAHLVCLDGQKWKFLRAKLSPTFTSGKIKGMLPIVKEAADILVESVDSAMKTDDIMEFREVCAQFTTDVIGSCVFGLQFNSLKDKDAEFRKMGRKVFEPSQMEKVTQIVRNIYPWMYKVFKFRLYSKEISDFFIGSVKATMEERKASNLQRNDFIHLLMQIRNTKATSLKGLTELNGVENYNAAVDEKALELTDDILAAQAFIFFLAGFETSSTALSFCLHEIAHHPEIQKKLHEEVDRVFSEYELTYDNLKHLKYMEQVLEETLRIYPPATILLRNCTQRYQIPNSDLIIEPGIKVFIPTWSFHHDPEFFPNPETFDPDRFSPENRDKIPMDAYLPFGLGPRICIGVRFAMMEMKIALSSLLMQYQFQPCEKTKPVAIDPRTFIMAPLDGIWLKVSKRNT